MMDYAAKRGLSWEMVVAFIARATPALLVSLERYEIVYATAAVDRLFGYSLGELAGQDLSVLIPEEQRDAHKRAFASYAGQPRPRTMGEGQSLSLLGRRRDGSKFPVSIQLSEAESYGAPRERLVVAIVVERVLP